MRFSIIIPVYQAEATLDRCLSSIVRQSFRDYQVVVVDDESTDGCVAIAQSYARQDNRFAVISAPHGGPGAARNRGLAHCRGEYVLYMDADDYWFRETLLQELDEKIRNAPADVYMYQMVKTTENGTVLSRYTKPPFENAGVVQDLKTVYQDLVKDGYTLAAAWNKCVRRELLLDKGIRFREDVFGEDIDWVLQLFSHTQTICLLNLWAYAYTQHHTPSRSTRRNAPNDIVSIVDDWAGRCAEGSVSHKAAVAGLVAFEYGICMGNHHLLSAQKKKTMRRNTYLLDYGMDGKTRLIRRFYKIFGYYLTCAAIRVYLLLRRVW